MVFKGSTGLGEYLIVVVQEVLCGMTTKPMDALSLNSTKFVLTFGFPVLCVLGGIREAHA